MEILDQIEHLRSRLEQMPNKNYQDQADFKQYVDLLLHDVATLSKECQSLQLNVEESHQSKYLFFSNMYHEIRTPLNAIVAFSHIMLGQAKKLMLPEDFLKHLTMIKQSGLNLAELFDNILDLALIDEDSTALSYETINLKLMVQGLYHLYKLTAKKRDIQFNYNLAPDLPEFISSDRNKLNQILSSLFNYVLNKSNIGKQFSIDVTKQQNNLIFNLTMKCPQIGECKEKIIIETFLQPEKMTTSHYGRSGLSLSLANHYSDKLGGHLDIQQSKDGYCLLSLQIPLQEVAPKEDILLENYHFLTDNVILLAEDEITNQEVIKVLFDELDLNIHVSENGQEVIDKVTHLFEQGKIPDLVLMDIHMPGLDGIETSHKIRQLMQGNDIPIVLLSADFFEEHKQAMQQLGINDYLTKPLKLKELLPLLTKYLRIEHQLTVSDEKQKLPLPENVNQQLLQEFDKLSHIPHFSVLEIFKQTDHMIQLCQPYESSYLTLLEEIKQASSLKYSKKIPQMIQEGLTRISHPKSTAAL